MPRGFHTATLLPNGLVLVAGGSGPDGAALNSAELYNPGTHRWSLTGSMVYPRLNHSAVLLPDGRVLVAGGRDPDALASAELYNPQSGTWRLTGSMNVARTTFPAVLLPHGKVLVAGGGTGPCCYFAIIASAEVYNTSTGMWTMTGSLNEARSNEPGMQLSDGTVLLAGGYSTVALATAELYHPSTGVWTSAGSMSVARCCNAGTVLSNGTALVIGGHGTSDTPFASAELYIPSLPPLVRRGQGLAGKGGRD